MVTEVFPRITRLTYAESVRPPRVTKDSKQGDWVTTSLGRTAQVTKVEQKPEIKITTVHMVHVGRDPNKDSFFENFHN